MKKKTKNLILSIVVTLILLLTFTVTYAVFSYMQTGTNNQQLVLGDIWMSYNEANGIDLSGAMPGDEYSKYFEFTISGKNTYTKQDIYYDVVLSEGDVPTDKKEENRIPDKYLKFKLVEVNDDDSETIIFTDKTYNDLTNKRIHVEVIPKNTTNEYKKTYRLYMVISENLIIGNTEDAVMTTEEFNNVFASIKVNVTGDFNEKIVYTDESCFEVEEIKIYTHNTNMTEEEMNACVNYFTTIWGPEQEGNTVDVGETYESFCDGTGTNWGWTFQEKLVNDWFSDERLTNLEENNIIRTGSALSITDYDETCGTDVVIPKTINNLSVIEIGLSAFKEKQLTSVVIPNSVTTIGGSAFSRNQLTSIVIPNSVTEIENYAFYENQLTSVEIPNSVTTIGLNAFADNQLTNVTFEENSKLEKIYDAAFQGDNHTITEVTIPDSVIVLSCNAFNTYVVINKRDDLVCLQPPV